MNTHTANEQADMLTRLDARDRELRISILTSEMLRLGIRVQKHWPTLARFRDETRALEAVNDVVALSMCKPGAATSEAIESAIDMAEKYSRDAGKTSDERDKRFWRDIKKECQRLKEFSDEAAALGEK